MQNVNTNETNLSGRVTTVPLGGLEGFLFILRIEMVNIALVVVPGDDDRDWEQTEMP